jgi:hypothetical protein
LPAAGGVGTIAVTTERECQWTAEPDAAWLRITAGGSGQGDGTVQFGAAPNPDPVARTGGIMLNGLRAAVSQAAAECRFELGSASASFNSSGGNGTVEVRASSPLCAWAATSGAEWVTITSGASGRGTSVVAFRVSATTGPPREAALTIAGQTFTVFQSQQQCAFSISAPTHTVGSAGGSRSVIVTTTEGCPWTAASNVPWITVTSAASGNGPGTVTFTVAATNGPARSGSLTVAGETVTVIQGEGCTYAIAPNEHSAPATGSSGTVSVTAGAACSWTATTNVPWITLAIDSGSGSGNVGFTVAATNGPARTGLITIAGQVLTVTQSPGCSFDVTPLNVNADASGGARTFTVSGAAGCAWSASSNAPWITVTSGASGSGPGTVTVTIAATTGPARSGTVTIAGRTVTVTQGEGCTYAIAPQSQNAPATGANLTVSVTAAAGCGWTAASQTSWIRVTSGEKGSGNGSVGVRVDATTGPARSGTVTIAGRTFTVNQGQGCTFSLSPTSASAPPSGATGTFEVRTANGCAWSAASNASWLTLDGSTTGSGNGTVRYTAAANSGVARTGTITAGGQTFTLTQDVGCTYSVSPETHTVASSGGTASSTVTTGDGCAWTATADATWITITSGASGSGSGPVQFTVAANTGAVRSGTITAAGRTVTVTQDAGCSYSVSPASHTIASSGGSASSTVTAPSGCAWTATADAGWISITSGASGSGTGPVEFTVAANTGVARTGTITAAGQTITVTQGLACSATIAPETIASAAAGSTQNVNITTPAECSWTAASNAAWIVIASAASGSGNATVQVDVQANTGPARSGTATIAGRTLTVTQDSGCTIALTPASTPMPIEGGPGSVAVSTAGGCTWTATSNVPWIVVTGGATGSGDGTVQFTVEANGTGAARSGTITIGGQTFTVSQAGPEAL